MSLEKDDKEAEKIFSFRRYFVNNLDSYHGEHVLAAMAEILEKNKIPSTQNTSQMIVGEDAEPLPPPPPQQPYEIVGTIIDPKIKSLDNVARIVPKSECIPQMLTCGNVVLDISYDREEIPMVMEYLKVLKQLLERQETTDRSTTHREKDDDDREAPAEPVNKRTLILISTVLTWALTKPLDPESPDLPFIETDFRKRKPHPNYKVHYDCENEVIGIARRFRRQIGALVVTTGLTYGGAEDVLFYWFQKAWECERLLPILGRGNNNIPIINVLDLAQIIYNLLNDFPKKLYILAVEQAPSKQREIIKPLGRQVGSGMFKCIPPEEAFLVPDINQRIYDLMTLNLTLEPTFIVETMGLQWTSELSFAENVPTLIKQFKFERKLRPFKVIIYGPPIVGKTTLSKMICENYGLVYISPESVVQDLIEDLTWRLQHWNGGELAGLGLPVGEDDDQADDGDDPGEEEGAQESARTTLSVLRSGRIPTDEELMGYLRQRLLSREAQNRGWLLDGFPTNLTQCVQLFDKGEEQDGAAEEENDEDQFDEDLELYNNVLKRILPDIVVYLDSTDDFVCEKAMRQPEGSTRLDEEIMLKRLTDFRAGDTRELTPLNFFDELDIHPLIVPVKDHTDYIMQGPYKAVTLRMGRPCRYAKLLALIEAAEKREKEETETIRHREEKALREFERKMKEEREEKMEYWSELYSLMREEEEAALAAAGEPMRNYLVHHIFPTLTPALLEVAKLRPDDPVDFLAEYLFKLNPAGKMLEPGYNFQAEKLLGKIKILDDALNELEIKIDPLLPPEAQDEDEGKDAKYSLRDMSAL